MARVLAHAEKAITASAADVYDVLADYRTHHPRIMPPDHFSDLEVESGGDRVDVDPPCHGVEVHPAYDAFDVQPGSGGVEVHPGDDLVEVDVPQHHLGQVRPAEHLGEHRGDEYVESPGERLPEGLTSFRSLTSQNVQQTGRVEPARHHGRPEDGARDRPQGRACSPRCNRHHFQDQRRRTHGDVDRGPRPQPRRGPAWRRGWLR